MNLASNRKQSQTRKRNRKTSSFSSFDVSSYKVGQGSRAVQMQTHPQLPRVHPGLGAGHKLLEAHLSAVWPLGCVQTQEKHVPVIVPQGPCLDAIRHKKPSRLVFCLITNRNVLTCYSQVSTWEHQIDLFVLDDNTAATKAQSRVWRKSHSNPQTPTCNFSSSSTFRLLHPDKFKNQGWRCFLQQPSSVSLSTSKTHLFRLAFTKPQNLRQGLWL